MLLRLEGEGVGVDACVGVAGVMPHRLDLVVVLARLVLHAILTVEDEAEGCERADSLSTGSIGADSWCGVTILSHIDTNGVGIGSRPEATANEMRRSGEAGNERVKRNI